MILLLLIFAIYFIYTLINGAAQFVICYVRSWVDHVALLMLLRNTRLITAVML